MWDKSFKGRYVLIEPTDYCNCDCIMCTRALIGVENPHNVPKGFMDLEVFKGIIDGLEFGSEPLAIKLFWIGESLLHPDFKAMLAYAAKSIKGKNAYIDLHTNATLLGKPIMDFILGLGEALPRITFSIDAASAETHGKVRRGGDFNKAVENMQYFVKERERSHLIFPRFIFQFVLMEENSHECKPFVDFWSDFLNRHVSRNLAEAWPGLSEQRKLSLLKQHGVYEKYMEIENGTHNI
jgi:sulfatase maturation enzyme AslB (radical SAM superfamily)